MRAKLTLAYAGVIAVLLSTIGIFIYRNFEAGLDTSLNRTMSARADDVNVLVRDGGAASLRPQRSLLTSGDLTVQLVAPDGHLLFSTAQGAVGTLVTVRELREIGNTRRFVDEGDRVRTLLRRTTATGDVVLVRASLGQRERALELLNAGLIVGGGVTLVVAALAGYTLAGAVLRPMEAMRRAAAAISDVDPHARLPLPVSQDEVHRLGATLNAMLARVESARGRERAFVSDASHELRTPLAILKTEVEVALRHQHPPEVLREALHVVGREADRLTLLAEDLLLIARSDSGHMELDRAALDVDVMLTEAAQRFSIRARQADRTILTDAPAGIRVVADRARILQALTNLVDNALRHGGGTITVTAHQRGRTLELHVLDEGAGLPDAFIPRAFERFSRPQSGRTGPAPGLAWPSSR